MFLLAEYTFGQGLLTVLSIFVFMAWILVLVTILGDLFRDHDTSGLTKALWVLFLIFIPFLAAFIYLIARGNGMRDARSETAGGSQGTVRHLRQAGRRRQRGRRGGEAEEAA